MRFYKIVSCTVVKVLALQCNVDAFVPLQTVIGGSAS